MAVATMDSFPDMMRNAIGSEDKQRGSMAEAGEIG